MKYSVTHEASFKHLEVYSLTPVGESTSLFVEFRDRLALEHPKKLTHLLECIKQLGDRGALIRLFRNEQSGSELLAIPKKNYKTDPTYQEDGQPAKNMLRLYCHRLNENVLFVFSGGLKTADDPLKCPNVKEHFLNGQEFCNAIDSAIRDKEIYWNEDVTDIDCSDDFIIEI
ncbi:hypothetical protein AAU57_13995 [Nonlabens sp. YIK11]|uniref:hypothetical protein n=1 Tax=Nonlabens sp. YIK11 TaxID=1453349 RepID=UPI0006DCABA7|nr:hypothetical protein [Nonlabens sp. YIK11]KQC34326.1 hypothetical protein AAU57_13995 [Nonlabens sp. YIK11]